MSATAIPFAPRETGADFARWTACLALVLGLHAATVLLLMRRIPIGPAGMPPEAVMLDLAPEPGVPVAEPAPQQEETSPPA
ncbi:hypothetical protein [Siccirubricoccus sp. G192]|uniref:hypothetical protein n=1 Tax=Siccirubricoccus sp. G192 TaxID=2849651 RepID=UPI001C2BE2C0|nr:hypothetical protein [Siccirubricoccus sp. G192]MBV1797607.1 hypothetical protein [Siccirubricoccus sp. G192]